MARYDDMGAPLSAPSQVERVRRDTGLSEHQQRERATIAAGWAWRITWLMLETQCSARMAILAIEDANEGTSR